MSDISLEPVWLSLELAGVTTVFLLIVATPLSWWLARTQSSLRAPITALVTLPLVLPPSVLGFYILVALGPHGPLGQLTQSLGWGLLTFTFPGLVVGSIIYRFIYAIVLYTKIMPVQGLRLATAVIVALAIAFPTIKNWAAFQKRKMAARQKGGR